MERKKFIDTFSDDLLCVEDAYKEYLKRYPEIESITWPSLCRVYTLVAISCIDFFIEYVLDKANISPTKNVKQNIEAIVKAALQRDDIPKEMGIPDKIRDYVYLRELRHFIAHTDLRRKREAKVKSIGLHLDVEKFAEKEFDRIKTIVGDVINLIGMSMVLIENPHLRSR